MQKPYLKLSAATATVPAPPPPSPYAQHQVSPRTIRRMATQSDTPLCLSLSLCSALLSLLLLLLVSIPSIPNPILHTPCSFPEQASGSGLLQLHSFSLAGTLRWLCVCVCVWVRCRCFVFVFSFLCVRCTFRKLS